MKIYRNIGVLNCTKATNNELRNIKELKNIGSLILSRSQQEALEKVNMINIGDCITIDNGSEIVFAMRNGEMDLKDEILKEGSRQSYFLVNGRIYLADLSEQAIDNIAGISLNGDVFGPEGTYGKIAQRLRINGNVWTYPDEYTFLKGSLTLNEEEILGYTGEESIAVKKLIALEPIPKSYLTKGKSKFYVLDEIISTKENFSEIAPFVTNLKSTKKTLVPEGYEYHENLTLMEENLINLAKAKIFVANELTIKVPLEMLEGKIDKIITKSLKILEGDMEKASRYVVKATEVTLINPNLFQNYAYIFVDADYLQGQQGIEIQNYGIIEFDPLMSKELLEKGLKSLENYGEVLCSKELKSQVMKKMKGNFGVLKFHEDQKSEQVDEDGIVENIGVLEL